MAWHNYNIITFENVKKFNQKSIQDCYSGSELFDNQRTTIDSEKVQKLETRIGLAWKLKELLKFYIPSNQLKDLKKKTHCPSYTACIYAAIYENDKDGILNISIESNSVKLEFRHAQPEFFSKEEIESQYGIKVGFQGDWFTIDLRHILRKKGTLNNLPEAELCYELDTSYFEEVTEILTGYVESITKFLNEGGKFAPSGESKAEVILFKDLHKLYYDETKSSALFLTHGARPITNPKTGNKLELDIQIEIIRANKPIKLAIEIQGRHHYPYEYKNNPELWENVENKHQTKINWCNKNENENKIIFVWLDWQAFNDVVVKDKTNKRKDRKSESRRNLVSDMIEKIISECNDNHFYIEIFAETDNSALTFSTKENRPKELLP